MKYLLAALMGFFFIGTTHAETIAATLGATYTDATPSMYYADISGAGTQNSLTSASNACSKWFGPTFVISVSANPTIYGTATIGTCSSGSTTATVRVAMTCPTGYTIESGTNKCTKSAYTCPTGQNWTLFGQTCTRPDCAPGETRNPSTGICNAPCPSGQTRVNGVCTCDNGAQTGTDGSCCPVSGSGGGAPMQWCYVDGPSASNCDSAGTNGCKVRCKNVTFQKGTGSLLQIYPKQALGQACSYTGTRAGSDTGGGPLNNDELNEVSKATGDPAKAKTPEGCLAAGMGYVTGSTGTTCVSGGDTGVTSKESGKETKSDGSSDTSDKTSEQGKNGTGKETSTETHTNPDGTSTTTTTEKTCHEDGTCTTTTKTETKDANGNKTGETTKNNDQSKTKFCDENADSAMCKGFEDTCKDHPERLGCMDSGEVPQEGIFSETAVGPSSISVVSVGGGGSCPQGPALPLGLGNFSFDGICQLANGIRPVILALAWLAAGLIVIGAFR